MVAAGSRGAITGEREILGRLPLARGEHYRHAFYNREGLHCVRADPRAEAAAMETMDRIAGTT